MLALNLRSRVNFKRPPVGGDAPGALWAAPGPQPEPPAGPAIALAAELFHVVEQFVVTTPDLDTGRFLQRLRSTAAGLTPKTDVPTLRLFRQWAAGALRTFGALQRRCLQEREDEIWRLLDAYARVAATGRAGNDRFLAELHASHTRLRAAARLPDLAEAREQLIHELARTREVAERKVRSDRARVAALADEVARLEAELAQVRRQTGFDSLTRLYHRGSFERELETLLSDGRPCTLAMLDLDDFRTINATLGHAVGDGLLVYVADQIRKVARSADVLARFRGDVFCFLAPGVNPEQLHSRLVGAVSRRHVRLELEERVVSVLLSQSVGIAAAQPGEAAPALLQRVEVALRAAKAAGKGCCRVAAP